MKVAAERSCTEDVEQEGEGSRWRRESLERMHRHDGSTIYHKEEQSISQNEEEKYANMDMKTGCILAKPEDPEM